MAKRIVTKIGDIFCAEIDGEYKVYFQYIANDMEQLNSPVIRVFKRRYPLDATPKMEEVVDDDIAFYSHTILYAGIKFDAWYKVGKSNNLGLEELEKVWFGLLDKDYYDIEKMEIIEYGNYGNWRLWHVNQDIVNLDTLPKDYSNKVELGWVFSYDAILSRLKYGYIVGGYDEYNDIKRIPWDDVKSYTKLEDTESEDVAYFYFLGRNLISELIVTPSGKVYLDRENPQCDGYKFLDIELGDINWRYKNFITAEEFNEAWGDHQW